MKTRTRITGVETESDGSGTPNTVEETRCNHCGEWTDEGIENGTQWICASCIEKDYIECPRCHKLELIDDFDNGVCYGCDFDDRLRAAMDYNDKLRQENFRQYDISKKFIDDEPHKHCGVIMIALMKALAD